MDVHAGLKHQNVPPSSISGGLPNSHAKSGGKSNERAAADLVTLPSESDLCVLPMNHLTRVVRRRRIGRCPPSPNSFSFSPTSNSVMNMEMKLSPPPLPLYFFLIPFLFPVWESPVSSLSLFFSLCRAKREVLMNEREGGIRETTGTQEFMECPDGSQCFRARRNGAPPR